MPLGIIELLQRVGENNVLVQPLASSLTGARIRKGGDTEVSFMTDQITPGEIMTGSPRQTGLVVWLPTEIGTRIIKEYAEREREVIANGQERNKTVEAGSAQSSPPQSDQVARTTKRTAKRRVSSPLARTGKSRR